MATSTDGPTMSPRQQFQTSVRRLGSEEAHCHKRNRSIHLKYNPYELQHVSSLRVSPSPRRSPYRASPTSLKQVAEEPDFGTEERDVWSRRSPSAGLTASFTLRSDVNVSPSPQQDSRHALPSLKPQIVVHSDLDERPKTRRGPEGPSAFESIASNENINHEERDSQPRKPKFVEGSMTSRSSALSSTWSDTDYATSSSEAEETDSEATPKASRKRRSGSFDLRDFQPPALTPSAIKRTLFGKRETKKERKIETTSQTDLSESGETKKPKKRLRKSMSRLGEKMRMFGSSSHDLSDQSKPNEIHTVQDEKLALEERKRKAEAAYAEQFGFKKQRDNAGMANVVLEHSEAERKELRGNQKYDSTTVRRRGGTTGSRRVSTGSIFNGHDQKPQANVSEHDIRKRPSRRELEKENQQLRALLRDSQPAREQTVEEDAIAYASESEPLPPVPPLKIRRKYSIASSRPTSSHSDVTSNSTETEADAPPLPPQHPDRRALSNISNSVANSRRSRTSRSSLPASVDLHSFLKEETNKMNMHAKNPLHNAPKLTPSSSERTSSPLASHHTLPSLPRSVSVIVEEPEDEIIAEKKRSLRSRNAANTTIGKENIVKAATVIITGETGGVRAGEEWQWPDDVF